MSYKSRKAAAVLMSAFLFISAFGGCVKKNGGADGNSPADGAAASENADTEQNSAPAADTFINTEWSYGQVAVGGGGFVTGVFAAPEKDVYYARTDVGGAYVRTPETGKWASMNYWVTEDDRGLLGVDGLAFDPQSPNRVFMLLGTEYFSNGKTAVAVSEDYGATVSVIDVTDKITVHGNGMGRGNGERIAVDPNNGNIIFAGGRTGGMIKSSDGGRSWESVSGFPVTMTANGNGINAILFDPSSAKDGVTQKIYAAVSQKNESAGNLFVSEDGGATWNKLKDSRNDFMIQRMKLDTKGNLYVCYINEEGPWNCNSGLICRYGTDGSVKEISPTADSFGDIVIDPNNENRLAIVTSGVWRQQSNGSYGDDFYVSEDGGESWKSVLSSMEMSTNGMPWVEGYAIHWCSCLAIDPFAEGKIMVNSGNGIFSCENIWADTPRFYFDALGVEETVPTDMISLEGMPLVSAIMDYDGHVHEDIFTPAERHKEAFGATTSISIAPKNKDVWVKTGGGDGKMAMAYSLDGGENWKRITKQPEEGKSYNCGTVALNADGSVLLWSPAGALKVFRTEDLGETWETCEGIAGKDFYLICDPNNPDCVYACGDSKFFYSTDGGKTFMRSAPLSPRYRRACPDPQNEGTVYVANGAGLYITKDYGKTADYIEGILYCGAVGLGRPKNDGDPYVIYIWGTPKGKDKPGIYMSEDSGGSWTQVNDSVHSFGGPGNGEFVCGDMNVYGRCYMSTVGLGIVYCDKNDK